MSNRAALHARPVPRLAVPHQTGTGDATAVEPPLDGGPMPNTSSPRYVMCVGSRSGAA